MISVIIPVYNAEDFIVKAIDSALKQKEVKEVLIIDDGSSDASLELCLEKAKRCNRVQVFFHKNHGNLGRSASRNLGIVKAKSKYIAFLDADDYYLLNRFVRDVEILELQPKIEGVYNAISAHYYREATLKETEKLKLTTIREVVPHHKLFELMGPMGHLGYFSGIGLTIRKTIFKKCGYFNENLEVAEDTELWLKMSLVSNLKGGVIDRPVAMRGVHESNVSFKRNDLYAINYLKMFDSLYHWSKEKKIEQFRVILLWKKLWYYRILNDTTFVSDLRYWISEIIIRPKMLFNYEVIKTFPVLKYIKRIVKQ